LLLVTVLLGLSTRWFPAVFPTVVSRYGGDVLWAAMVFWIAAVARPNARTARLAAFALTLSFAVEISQLYRAPWIDAVRETTGGALVLGQGFLWSDLVSYLLGVLFTAMLDARLVARRLEPVE
jgi:Protein of unknown function (DUF2809)